ncbi:unnamed protein product [Staurois parvus]|uniref:Uncharacterized protein n=1 Tax=Staurois parvus TaxID=386267 RepID=A0ABN9FK47_9NEOB|nr:unnamed protein product [Staurois parvus]
MRKVLPRTGSFRAGIGTDHQGTDDQCPDDRCSAVPPASSAHLCPAITHLCPAVHPPVPSSAPTCATLQCHLPVPRSATYL